ncbi:hypothetical protein HDU78_003142 [Chytriomyces hyalinus]|nr:hypothetical protein HDU78_003142 [Chytriomyces hyalinus]
MAATTPTHFHPLLGRAVPPKPTSCVRCRKKHRSCDQARPVCARCAELGAECIYGTDTADPSLSPFHDSKPTSLNGFNLNSNYPKYSNHSNSSPPAHTSAHALAHYPSSASSVSASVSASSDSPSPPPSQRPPVLDGILLAAEDPFSMQNLETRIEDPDLLPTYEDFSLVYSLFAASVYFRSNDFVVHNLLDKDHFLASFFAQPAPLRYVLCALAAYTAEPPLPIHLAISYFNKARKAVYRSSDKPSVRILEAVVLITTFALGIGQPSVGKPFMALALRMLFQLNLHLDPDTFPNALSDSEKDELRMLFWRVLYHLKYALCITDYASNIDLEYFTVKPPPATELTVLMQSNFGMWDVLLFIKKKLRVTPSTVADLLVSASELELSTKVIQTHAQIPAMLILVPNLDYLDSTASQCTQYDALIQQTMLSSPSNPMGILQLSMNYHASLCLLLRPKLYLTAFMSPMCLDVEHSQFIQTALEESLIAAQRICILLKLTNYAWDIKHLDHFKLYWMRRVALVPSLFEAAVILYFVTCRTRPEWRGGQSSSNSSNSSPSQTPQNVLPFFHPICIPDNIVLEYLSCILLAFHTLYSQLAENAKSNRPNMMTPLIECVEAMVLELSRKQDNASINAQSANLECDLILLEMKVMSLNDDTVGDEDEVLDSTPVSTDEPWVYMGLLGIDINKRVRWNGPYEDNWRRFWKQLDADNI